MRKCLVMVMLYMVAGCGGGNNPSTIPATESNTPAYQVTYSALQPTSPGYIVTPASPIQVIDGDTAIFGVQYPFPHSETVRFLGVDTPERGQCYSGAAADYTSNFVASEPIKLVCESNGSDYHRDVFGRALCYVYSSDMARSLNEELLNGGYAMGFFAFPFEFRSQYMSKESQAVRSAAGLWGNCGHS